MLLPTNNSFLLKEKKVAFQYCGIPLAWIYSIFFNASGSTRDLLSEKNQIFGSTVVYWRNMLHCRCIKPFKRLLCRFSIHLLWEFNEVRYELDFRWRCKAGSVSVKQYRFLLSNTDICKQYLYLRKSPQVWRYSFPKSAVCVFFHCQNNSSLQLLHSCLGLTSSIHLLKPFTALGKDVLSTRLEEAKCHTGSQAVIKFPLRTMKGEFFVFVCVCCLHINTSHAWIYIWLYICWNTNIKIQLDSGEDWF